MPQNKADKPTLEFNTVEKALFRLEFGLKMKSASRRNETAIKLMHNFLYKYLII